MKPVFLLFLPLLGGCLEPDIREIARRPFEEPAVPRPTWNDTMEALLPAAEMINETSGTARRFYDPAK